MNRDAAPPRNYFGIPLANPAVRDRPAVGHDALDTRSRLTGALELEIEPLSPVHVGSGAFELVGATVTKEPARRNGVLTIPGTSIKGVCRQTFEALTESGSPFDKAEFQQRSRGDQPSSTLSAAASLFGTLGLQGRVSFDDAIPAGASEPDGLTPGSIALSVAYPPNNEVGRRFYGPMPEGASQPATIPALAIPTGTLLRSTLRFRNVSRRELGELLVSLGVEHFTPRLGGGKYDDFGWVRFRATAFRIRTTGLGPFTWERDPSAVESFVADCLARVEWTGPGRDTLDLLVRKLQFGDTAAAGQESR